MILNPILRFSGCNMLNQIRNIRPTIKIAKDKFQLTINVHQFTKDEIRVKARAEYVVVEGKQERKTKRGYIIRQFARRFRLPSGCSPGRIQSTLTPEGTLTITAPRETCEINHPCETTVPITYSEKKPCEESIVEVQSKFDVCRNLLDDKPKKT